MNTKSKLFYTVYKITNLMNGRIYIGCHQTHDLNDDYMGSGKLIRRAIAKYGRANFQREYIGIFETSSEMFAMESQLVNDDLLRSGKAYNIKRGGSGGWDHIHKDRDLHKSILDRANHALSQRMKDDPQFRQRVLKNRGDGIKRRIAADPALKQKIRDAQRKGCKIASERWRGRKHSPESIEKMRASALGRAAGSNHPQFGNSWMYSIAERRCIRVPREEIPSYEANGWIRGRKMRFD